MDIEQSPKTGNSGEAGHQGRDRQAQKDVTRNPAEAAPSEQTAATPPQAKGRSAEAKKPATPVDQPDAVHPGPGRYELERSKGNLHHKQHEPQPDMGEEVKEL